MPLDSSDMVHALLEEYSALQDEKRSAYQTSVALLALIVTGSVAVISASVRFGTYELLIVLVPGQIALVAIMCAAHATSIRMAAYLATLEARINSLLGSPNLLKWESINSPTWSASGWAILKLQDPVAIVLAVATLLLGLAMACELAYVTLRVWKSIIDGWLGAAMSGIYLALALVCGLAVVPSWHATRAWALALQTEWTLTDTNERVSDTTS